MTRLPAATSAPLLAAFLVLALGAPLASALSGRVTDTSGTPLSRVQVVLLDPGFGPVADNATESGADGAFSLPATPEDGFLVVQPKGESVTAAPALANGNTSAERRFMARRFQPRIYVMAPDAGTPDLALPAAVSLVFEAYDANGKLMRWKDFETLGRYGGQFMYATNLDDEMVPATCWPIFGSLAGLNEGPREAGLPSVLIAPSQVAAVSFLFWPVPGYGKLMLKADNAGTGYSAKDAGGLCSLILNYELARTAVHDLSRRKARYPESAHEAIAALEDALAQALAQEEPRAIAKAADSILCDALRLRDRLELEAAQAAIPVVRKGTLVVKVEGGAAGCEVRIAQENHDFLFGVMEGSPYEGTAYEIAREAGFEYATILPAWNWTRNPKLKKGVIDRIFGISALGRLGYRIKAHGVVWMQGYGIMPDDACGMAHADLGKAVLSQQQSLLDVFGAKIDIWEAMNEPAATNVPGVPRAGMMGMLGDAAAAIKDKEKPSLVNSPHELSHGAKYLIHRLDGQPLDDYALTFSAFLSAMEKEKGLDNIDIVGLQFYPGFHLNQDFGGLQGPAYTPAALLDTVERYTRFGKDIHITEVSMPSSYGGDWFAGYWRKPWDEATQADYAEAVYTLAFAHPKVHSVTWWDITDAKPSVLTGGLLAANGAPKPAFERIKDLIAQWTTNETQAASEQGEARFEAFAGDYTVTATRADGTTAEASATVAEGGEATCTITLD